MTHVGLAAHISTVLLEEVSDSKTNPRRVLNGPALDELAASVKEHGVLQPVLVRQVGKGYELVAGHRRAAAARKAGLVEIPALVRKLTDQEVLEIQLIENLQRSDLHPLEEAEGYRQLRATKNYDVARIAERIGRSVKYVYDRVKLLSLTKDAQQLFLDDRITAGHAIILARLKPVDQKRALDVEGANHYGRGTAPLFQEEHTLFTPAQDDALEEARTNDPYFGLKVRSVRELQAWVDRHVKFDLADADVPDLFPETHGAVARATEAAEKIVQITHEYQRPVDARDGSKIYGPMSWRRADEKTCEHSVTGVIVIGAGRGEAAKVCVAKEKCKTHWGDWQRQRAKRAKSAALEGSTGEARQASEQRLYKEEQEKREAERKRREKAIPEILKEVAAAVQNAPIEGLGDLVLSDFNRYGGKLSEAVPRGETSEDLIRHLAYNAIRKNADGWSWEVFAKRARAVGVDVTRILEEAAPVQTSAKPEASVKKAVPAKRAKKKSAVVK